MRYGYGRMGLTLIEFIAASSIATVIGGVMLVLMTGVRDAYQAHTTLNQLSGYLDAATTVLRKDIWEATSASPPVGTGLCSDAPGAWLTLTRSGTTIEYCLDNSELNNVKLRRRVNGGAVWPVAQNVIQDVVPANSTIALVDNPGPGLITLNLVVRRTVNGRAYFRNLTNVRYRMQMP